MQFTLHIPDSVATHILPPGTDQNQRILEDLAAEWYRREAISLGQLAEMLSLSIDAANGFLKDRGIFDDLSAEDLESQTKSLANLLALPDQASKEHSGMTQFGC